MCMCVSNRRDDTGLFAGVELDDPAGKNDGAVKGRRYFKCKPHHGILVRPHYVEVCAAVHPLHMAHMVLCCR